MKICECGLWSDDSAKRCQHCGVSFDGDDSEKNIDVEDIPVDRIFTESKIGVAAYIGGPLAAGYIISKNYKVFKEEENAKKVLIVSIISTILLFLFISMLPEEIIDKIPNMLIPLTYTSAAAAFASAYQGKRIKEHIANCGESVGWGKTLGISFLGLIITFVLIIVLNLILE